MTSTGTGAPFFGLFFAAAGPSNRPTGTKITIFSNLALGWIRPTCPPTNGPKPDSRVVNVYCPVDGAEYREGITRCPQHDVALVEEPPEIDEPQPWLDRVSLEGLPGWAAVILALAGIVYAVAGTIYSLWIALAESREWTETPTLTAVGFAQSAAWAIGLGAFGCLAAAVLGRTYVRLTRPPAPALDPDDEDDEDDDLPPESNDWFMPVVSTLTICFAVVWMALALVVAWKTRNLADEFGYPSGDLSHLYAYQSAAAACTLGSLVVMGALLMGRAHDRLSGSR